MSIKIEVPHVGEVEIQQFIYQSGRRGLIARTSEMKEGKFFNLTVDITGQMPNTVILKEYDQAQLVNKYLMEADKGKKYKFAIMKKSELGHNYIYYCLMPKNFAA